MGNKYESLAFTDSVKSVQQEMGSRSAHTLREAGRESNSLLGPKEAMFIAGRDGFYIASCSETGWPYVQFRGGPPGFLRLLDKGTLGYADFKGNRQYITTGNVLANNRVALFLMDYPHRRRLKIFGHMKMVAGANRELVARLSVENYPGGIEQAVLIKVAAFDWNCPQHITPRYTKAEHDAMMALERDQFFPSRLGNPKSVEV